MGSAATTLAVAAAYVAATYLSLRLVVEASGVALVWLPAGVAFGALWTLGARRWPLVALADLVAQAAIGNPAGFLPFTVVANTLGAVAAVHLARRLSAAEPGTYSVRTAAVLSLSGLTLGAASAPLGVAGLVLNGMLPATAWVAGLLAWVTADAFGLLLVAPAVILALTALGEHGAQLPARPRRGERRAWFAAAVSTVALVFAAGEEIASSYPMALTAGPLALLLWAAVRFPPLFTAVATLAAGLFLAFLLVAGLGPVGAPGSTLQAAGVLMFLSVLVVTPLLLAAYSGDRQRALDALAAANAELESRVAARTAELQGVLDTLRSTQASLVRQETLAGLGRLVAGVAHELNTPLDVVVTVASRGRQTAEALQQALQRPKPQRALLLDAAQELSQGFALVLDSGRRAAQLIVAFRQVAIDQHNQQRRTCDLAQVVGDAVLALGPAHRERITLVLDAEPCTLETYPGALFSVLQQLVANAARHAYPDSVGELQVQVRAEPSGGGRIELADQGVGMSEAIASRAFQPFVAGLGGSGGPGLGLLVVHNVVVGLLGGEVELVSAPGRGCRFVIQLPAVAPNAAAAGAGSG